MLEPILQSVRSRFGGVREAAADLAIRYDHGSQYMSRDFQNEIAFLGAESTPPSSAAPKATASPMRFIRTIKEQVLWVQDFDSAEDLRLALLE